MTAPDTDDMQQDEPHLVGSAASAHPTDHQLVRGILLDDHDSFARLMDRYDRLVRYTIYRLSRGQCYSDPQWLDSVASETWAGFVASVRRTGGNPPSSIRAYLVQTARNKAVSAVRAAARQANPVGNGEQSDPASKALDPEEVVDRLERAEALQDCIQSLSDGDKTVCAQLEAITERRWRDAARALDLPESTLRSRWKKILDRLRHCMRKKTGEPLAPDSLADD